MEPILTTGDGRALRALLYLGLIAVGFVVVSFVATVATYFSDILAIFFLAWLLAFLLDPLATFLEGAVGWIPRPVAVLLTYALIATLLVVIVVLISDSVANSIRQFVEAAPQLRQELPQLLAPFQERLDQIGLEQFQLAAGATAILDSFNAGSGEVLRPIQQIAVFGAGAFGTFSIIVFLSLYMAADGARLQGSFRRLFPARFEADIAHFESSVARSFGGFIRGQVILGLFYGTIAFITCFALHLPFLPLVVVTVAVLHVIPFFGPFFSWAPPVVVAVFFVPAAAFPAFVVMGISMLLLMNLVQPRLMGDAVGLHPVAVLGSVLIGAKLAGVLGAIFAVPVAAVIAAVITQWRTRMFAAPAAVSEAGEVDAAAASPDVERGRPVAGADVRRSPQPGSLVPEPAFVTRFANAVRWWFGGPQPAPPDRSTSAEPPVQR